MIDSRRKREDVAALYSTLKRQRCTQANTAAKPISFPCTVMIAGLSNDCTVLELKSRFEIFGPISRIRIDAVDGYGHVTFRSDDAAETAISAALDPAFGITIRSKKVLVVRASDPLPQREPETRAAAYSKLLRAETPLRKHGRSNKKLNPGMYTIRNVSDPYKGREIVAYDDLF